MNISEVIREAERIKRHGGGISEYRHAYDAMLRTLKELSHRVELWGDE